MYLIYFYYDKILAIQPFFINYFFFFYSSCFTISSILVNFVHLFCIIKFTCMFNLKDEIQSIHVNYMIVQNIY